MSSPIGTPHEPREGTVSLRAIALLGVGTLAFFAGMAVIASATLWGAVLVAAAVAAFAAAALVGVRAARRS